MGGCACSGILLIDKPEGRTSADVVAKVKKLLGACKAGHTGTLDPFATGLMVCLVGGATKLARFFNEGWKTYEAVLCLGVETDTLDSTGKVVATSEKIDLPEKTLRAVIQSFEGKQRQIPPIFSALKHRGVPLYKLARRGEPVRKPARDIHIASIRITDIHVPEICFEVTCSSGTYIRSLCADIGKSLGCGGHLKALRRTRNGGFTIDEAVTLNELERLSTIGKSAERIVPMADALKDMPRCVADSRLIEKILYGKTVANTDLALERAQGACGYIKIVDHAGDLIALFACSKETDTCRYIVNFAGWRHQDPDRN